MQESHMRAVQRVTRQDGVALIGAPFEGASRAALARRKPVRMNEDIRELTQAEVEAVAGGLPIAVALPLAVFANSFSAGFGTAVSGMTLSMAVGAGLLGALTDS